MSWIALSKIGSIMVEKVSSPRVRNTLQGGDPVIRLEDVAAAAGVSTITASRCVSNPGRVSKKTREHVLQVAAQLGYIPNRLASSLASSRTKVIGAVIPTMLNPVHSVFVNSLLTPWVFEPLLVLWALAFVVASDLTRRLGAPA